MKKIEGLNASVTIKATHTFPENTSVEKFLENDGGLILEEKQTYIILEQKGIRIRATREQAERIWPRLRHFSETGELIE